MSKVKVDLSGVDTAIARHAGTKIHDCTFRKPSLVGLLYGLDTHFNKGANVRFKPLGLKGGKMRFSFWAGAPTWQKTDPSNPDYDQRKVDIRKRHKLKSGDMEPCAYIAAEPVDIWDVNRLTDDDLIDDWGMEIGELLASQLITKFDEELFPAVQAVGGAGSEGGRNALMQFSYPLQNGYLENDTTDPANKKPFVYLGMDMHAFPEAQAINRGTVDDPFVPTEQNIMEEILMPLHDRGGKVDIILAGKKTYAYLRQVLQSRIQQQPAKLMNFGGTYFQLDDGVFVIYESGIDRLPYEEMYIGDSSTLRFAPPPDGLDKLSIIEEWAEHPDSILIQGYAEGCFVNECPRWWARAFNCVPPNS